MSDSSIYEVAKLCGVSVSTVSRALNGHPDVKEEKRKLIEMTAKNIGYIPNRSARNLKITSTKSIVVLVKGIMNPFFAPIIEEFENEIHHRKYTFELQNVNEQQDEVTIALEIAKEKKPSGLIFLGGDFSKSGNMLEKLKIPFVLSSMGTAMGDEVRISKSSRIITDDREASRIMANYLISRGHTKIAMLLANESLSISKRRLEGYKDALKEHNIPFDKELILGSIQEHNQFSIEHGYKIMKKHLNVNRISFTAVMAISDTLAIGAMRAINESGLKIPQDISVAGFDGIDIGRYTIPSLTTMSIQSKEIAKESLRLLFNLIDGKTINETKDIDVHLVIRESTN